MDSYPFSKAFLRGFLSFFKAFLWIPIFCQGLLRDSYPFLRTFRYQEFGITDGGNDGSISCRLQSSVASLSLCKGRATSTSATTTSHHKNETSESTPQTQALIYDASPAVSPSLPRRVLGISVAYCFSRFFSNFSVCCTAPWSSRRERLPTCFVGFLC